MIDRPSPTTVQVWTRLMRVQQASLARIEAALKQASLPPLVWYDVLLELSRTPERGLRPFELERSMLLPQYGVSRLLDRMEKAGCLKRERCDDDGRGLRAVITKHGAELQRRMWPIYAAAMEEALGRRLGEDDAKHLNTLLASLLPEPGERS